MSSKANDFADLMLSAAQEYDHEEAADKVLDFLEKNYDLVPSEKERFLYRIQQLAFPDIKPLELTKLIELSYERILHERQVHRSQGH